MSNLRIPPPLQGLFWGLSIWAVSNLFDALSFSFPIQKPLGFFFIGLGLCIDLISINAFRKARTTVNPVKIEKASSLVISGLYRISRNPMYLGLALILTGWAILLGNPLNIALLGLFILCMNILQIKPEEQLLKQKFGQDYLNYQARVRRWI